MSATVQVHPYECDPHSGAGNCWCGWPELWGGEPPPIHGGPSWTDRKYEVPEPGLVRARGVLRWLMQR